MSILRIKKKHKNKYHKSDYYLQPVNKKTPSRRVHHIANLTTALAVLRRRGLELINNNAADLADGNPHIVLGLIWQIILHFQVETNIALLSEWGWGEVVPLSPSLTRSSPFTSPIKSLTTKLSHLTPSRSPRSPDRHNTPSTSREVPSPREKHYAKPKASVEPVLLRWLNAEIGSAPEQHPITDLDKSWRSGVNFCALVHKFRPEMIDMTKVRARADELPRENVELAFETAFRELGVRRLIEVDDIISRRPDRRSIITYVSQFVRYARERRVTHERKAEEFAEFIGWLNTNYMIDITKIDVQEYFRVRREFLEHRRAYQSIFSTKTAFTLAELTEIERKWNKLRISLDMAAARADHASLPHELAELSEWIAQGRALLNSHIKLTSVEPSKDRMALHQALSSHNKHFADLHRRREILEVHGVEVTAETLEPLKLRMDNIAEEAPSRAATLRALLAHATSRAYIAELEDKVGVSRFDLVGSQ
ncbi:anc-1 [Pristionchus pacificus]|nr:anc-1 [Pristionchus pacificus]